MKVDAESDLKSLIAKLDGEFKKERAVLWGRLKEKSQEVSAVKKEMAGKLASLKDEYAKKKQGVENSKTVIEGKIEKVEQKIKGSGEPDIKPLFVELNEIINEERSVLLDQLKEKSGENFALKKEMAKKLAELENEYTKKKKGIEGSEAVSELKPLFADLGEKLKKERTVLLERLKEKSKKIFDLKRERLQMSAKIKAEYARKDRVLEKDLKKLEEELNAAGGKLKEEQKEKKELETKLLSREEELERIKLRMDERKKFVSDVLISNMHIKEEMKLKSADFEFGKGPMDMETQVAHVERECNRLHEDIKEFSSELKQDYSKLEKKIRDERYKM